MTPTQDQLAALAALVGINDKTHPWLFGHLYCSFCAQWGNSRRCQSCGKDTEKARHIQSYLPALDTAAGDDVFGMPLMRWLIVEGYSPQVFGKREDLMFSVKVGGVVKHHARSAVFALLRACQAAVVPEIVAIFGRGNHDAR